MKQAAAVVGGTIMIWQIIMLFLLQKVIFSLWHLINILQFFVYIALWQINYPRLTSVILMELRKIALGEFLEELQIGKNLAEFFGIPSDSGSESDLKEDQVGIQRLGSKFISQNLGVSFFVSTALIVLTLGLILGFYWCFKNCQSKFPRLFERLQKLKTKVLWNPIIRYTYLNSIKFN